MGITIHYRGKLRAMKHLLRLIEEVTELCQHVGWETEIIYRSFEVPVHGIAFAPKRSEPVWMTFLDDGTLMSPERYLLVQELGLDVKKEGCVETKTHYAGANNHIRMVLLIKYLGAKYFSTFGMHDESQYWQTGNEAICKREFEIMEQWVAQMISRLDELDGRTGEIGDAGELVDERIAALMERMPMVDVLDHLDTPRPVADELSRMDN